jgi:hypothetical protein
VTKKSKPNRFDYATRNALDVQPLVETSDSAPISVGTPTSSALTTVGRRSGRMEQDREQLNVRLPTQLKRHALAAAALEGLTVGELVENLLLDYLKKR